MIFLKTAIFLVALLALHVKAEGLKCETKDVQATSATVKWCESTPVPSNSTVTIEAKPVGLVVDGIVRAEDVPGCETVLENLCSKQKYQVTVKGGTDQETCEFNTEEGDVTNVERNDLSATSVRNTVVRLSWKHARCFCRDGSMYYKIQTDFDGSTTVEDHQAWGDKSLNETYDWYDKTVLGPGIEYRFTFSTCKRSGNICSRDHHVEKITTDLQVPDPPQNLNINNLQWNEFEMSWEEPSDTLDGYRVTVDGKPVDLLKNENKHLVQDLSPNTQYKVQVMTRYKGVTSAALSTTVWTKEEMLNPPQNLKFVSLESDVIEISWEKPSDTADIDKYRVTLGQETKELPGDKTTFRVENLEPNTQYKVEVVAFYQKLTSVPLSTTAWTKVLNPPQNLKNVSLEWNAFNISWEKPSGTTEIGEYIVTVDEQPENVSNTTTFRVDGRNETTLYVKDLKPNTQYNVRVVAFYKQFASLPLSITVQTKEKRYSPPSNLTIDVENIENIVFKWSAPKSSDNEPVVKYQVFVDDQLAGNVSSNDTTFRKVFKSTQPLTVYWVKVLARYGEGDDVSDAAETDICILKSGAISSLNFVQKEVLGFFTLLAIFLTWSRS